MDGTVVNGMAPVSEAAGGQVDQMTDGIEITPPSSSFEKAQADGKTISRALVEVTLSPDSLKSVEDHIDRVVDDMIITVAKAPKAEAPVLPAVISEAGEMEKVPDARPAWLAPALQACRAEKDKAVLRLLAHKGAVTLQQVIYHFSPPMKETYALNVISGVRRLLKAAGWDLVRDEDGQYTARLAE
jgi:hypothetical protein